MGYIPEITGARIKDGTIQAADLAPGVGSSLPVGSAIDFEGFTLPSGWLWADGQPISRTSMSNLLSAVTITRSATLNGTVNVTGTNTNHLRVGCPVEGTNIPAGATVAAIVSTTAFTLSVAASGSGSSNLTFFPHGNARETTVGGTTNGQVAVTIADGYVRGRLSVGMSVTGTGIQGGTTIATVTATGITLSATATATGSPTLTFVDATKFNTPDSRGVVHVGMDNLGVGVQGAGNLDSTFAGLGTRGGAQTHALTPVQTPLVAHTHSGTTSTQSANHTHSGTSGNDNIDHSHSGTTGTVSSDHGHNLRNTALANTGALAVPTGAISAGQGTGTARIMGQGSVTLNGDTNGITANHTHTITTGGRSAFHQHSLTTGNESANHTHTVTTGNPSVAEANGTAHNNMQPTRVVNRIVYAGV